MALSIHATHYGYWSRCLYFNSRCEFESHSGEVYSIQHYVIKLVGITVIYGMTDMGNTICPGHLVAGIWHSPFMPPTMVTGQDVCISTQAHMGTC
jgi:hypothetical protein